ncbi:MAG: nucleotidyltransferase family protein [Chitinophagaceae bacterium]|nr:nucleotidyltransferase family protein [Chitinophagaceae bacterium]
MINQAIILAGGLGTRLRSAVPDLPKCMAPVAGKPFLEHVIDYFQLQGINEFIFAVGYKSEIIIDFVKVNYPDLVVDFSIEKELLGTGGAIRQAAGMARHKDVLVLNGDTIFKIDVSQLSDFHETASADCSIVLKPMTNFERYGVVEISTGNKINSFKEKQFYESGLISGGIYALNIDSFLSEEFPEKFSFEKEYLEALYTQRNMFGIVQDRYFIDIGIPADYDQAQIDFK